MGSTELQVFDTVSKDWVDERKSDKPIFGADGAQGIIWELKGASGFVYKEYQEPQRYETDFLYKMMRFCKRLSRDDQDRLLYLTAWPFARVRDGHHDAGYIMQRIPKEFYFILFHRNRKSYNVENGKLKKDKEAQFQFLLNSPEYFRSQSERASYYFASRSERGENVESLQRVDTVRRLAILKKFAVELEFLHRIGVVVGDISPRNMLWSTIPECRVFLLDADSMAIYGESGTKQKQAWHTPFWWPPDPSPIPSKEDDIYKLGLMVLRTMTGSQNCHKVDELERSVEALKPLLERSLDGASSRRPRAGEWAAALERLEGERPRLEWLEEALKEGSRKGAAEASRDIAFARDGASAFASNGGPADARNQRRQRDSIGTRERDGAGNGAGAPGTSGHVQPLPRPRQVKRQRHEKPKARRSQLIPRRTVVLASLLALLLGLAALVLFVLVESDEDLSGQSRPPFATLPIRAVSPTKTVPSEPEMTAPAEALELPPAAAVSKTTIPPETTGMILVTNEPPRTAAPGAATNRRQ